MKSCGGFVSSQEEEETRDPARSLFLCHVRTKGEGSCLQARKESH